MNVLPVQVGRAGSRTSRSVLAAVASAALLALSLTFPSSASAGSSLTICHSTSSNSNPYITNSPDKTADAGGHAGHTGPVWSPTLPKGTDWGDIIPPFDIDGGGKFPGLNWTVDGQEIWNNGCQKVNPDLKLTKTGSGSATQGTSGSYTISVSNIGNGTAHAPFTVSDTMPTGVVATAVSGGSWSCTLGAAGASISCTWSTNLAPKAAADVITVTVTWATTGSKKNTASVTVLPDDPPANNSASTTSSVTAAPAPPNAISVNVDKTSDANGDGTYSDGETAPAGGGNVTYRVKITNPTNFDLTVDAITDVVDSAAGVGVTCAANVPAGQTGTSLGATLPASLPKNSTRYCYFQLAGPADGESSTDNVDVDVHETADSTNTTSNDDDTTVHRAAPPPDPSATITKTNNANGDSTFSTAEEATSAGQQVRFKLHITNTSPYAINVGQGVSDKVWTTAEEPSDAEPSSYQCEAQITNLAPGDSADCFFNAPSYAGPDGQVKSDRATLTLSKYVPQVQFESVRRPRAAAVAGFTATSNVSTVTTKLPRATAVAPSVSPSVCANGAPTTPTYTVPSTTGLTYSPASGVHNATAGSTVNVTATANVGYVLANPGALPFSITFPAAPNCSSPPPVVLPSPSASPAAPDDNLGISKTGPGSAKPGDELVYTVEVTNVKGTPATGFSVTDVLPPGLSFSSAQGPDFTCLNAGQSITCQYAGTLAMGQKASFIVRALLDGSYTGKTVANTAVVDPGRADTDSADNSATATTDVVPLPLTGGGGGAAEEPSPAPSPSPAAGGGGGGALPFTGSNSGQLLQLGVTLLLVGLVAALVARRRRVGTE